MVRLEDVSALVSVTAMKSLTDYLYQRTDPVFDYDHSVLQRSSWRVQLRGADAGANVAGHRNLKSSQLCTGARRRNRDAWLHAPVTAMCATAIRQRWWR